MRYSHGPPWSKVHGLQSNLHCPLANSNTSNHMVDGVGLQDTPGRGLKVCPSPSPAQLPHNFQGVPAPERRRRAPPNIVNLITLLVNMTSHRLFFRPPNTSGNFAGSVESFHHDVESPRKSHSQACDYCRKKKVRCRSSSGTHTHFMGIHFSRL